MQPVPRQFAVGQVHIIAARQFQMLFNQICAIARCGLPERIGIPLATKDNPNGVRIVSIPQESSDGFVEVVISIAERSDAACDELLVKIKDGIWDPRQSWAGDLLTMNPSKTSPPIPQAPPDSPIASDDDNFHIEGGQA